jgi:antitoxin component YwqK of YwqJK toxin-antitoxin module
MHYRLGLRHGPFTHWYENGARSSAGQYVDDKAAGEFKTWYNDGKVQSTKVFNKGEKTGVWTQFDRQGRKISEVAYRNGVPVQ